jgi:hypothetical protein
MAMTRFPGLATPNAKTVNGKLDLDQISCFSL